MQRDYNATAVPRFTSGDGGASWKLRALRRAQERAHETGGDLAAVVAERWGSVNELVEGSKGARLGWRRPQGNRSDRGDRVDRDRDERGGEGGGRPEGRESDGRREGRSDEGRGDDRGERGGGLRIGRGARDTDVLARFRDKVTWSSPLPCFLQSMNLDH